MNRNECAFVDTWLDTWIAGCLPAEAARRIETHLRECERCRRLEAVVRGTEERPAGMPEIDLLPGVIEKTTGDACERAEELLPAFADGGLDADTRALVESHLAHCGGCAALLAALEEARQVLPSLVELEPPAGFAARVLAVTSRAPRPVPLVEWAMRILARPRASFELAYVGTVLMVVLLGNPVAAFRGAGEQATRLAASVPIERLAVPLPAGNPAAGFVSEALTAITSTIAGVASQVSHAWSVVAGIVRSVASLVADAANWLRTLDWKEVIVGVEKALLPDATGPPAKQAERGRR